MPVGISPKAWVDNFDIILGDEFGIIAMFFVKTFFEGIIHGVDGGFAIVVAPKGIDVRFLDEKE